MGLSCQSLPGSSPLVSKGLRIKTSEERDLNPHFPFHVTLHSTSGVEEMMSFSPAEAVPLDIDKLSIDASIDYSCATYWKTYPHPLVDVFPSRYNWMPRRILFPLRRRSWIVTMSYRSRLGLVGKAVGEGTIALVSRGRALPRTSSGWQREQCHQQSPHLKAAGAGVCLEAVFEEYSECTGEEIL